MKKKLLQFENWLLWLSLFLIPWQLRHIFVWGNLNGNYFEYGSLSLYAVDVAIILLLLLWFFRKKFKDIDIGPKIIMMPLMMFVVWATASIFWAQDVLAVVMATAHYWLFFIFLIYLINEAKDWNKIFWPFVLGISFQAVLGVAQYLMNSSIGLTWLGESILHPEDRGGIPVVNENSLQLRAHGMLPHANIFGGFMSASLPIFWYLYYKADLYKRQILLMLLILVGVGVALSFSRTAWIALILVAVGGVIVGFKTNNKMLFQAIGLTMLAFLLALGPQFDYVLGRLNISETIEQISINERIEGVESWQQVVNNNSTRGVGVGNYAMSLVGLDNTQTSRWYQPVHNIYMLMVGELGVIGGAIWLWLVGVIMWLGWKIWVRKPEFTLIFLVPSSVLVMGLFDHWPISLQQGRLLLFFALALIILVNKVSYKGHINREK